jgi:hypothetical protein
VPQADLANFDPVWRTTQVVRNASVLVWDTLYGVDDKHRPQRQMVEAEEVSADGLVWTFRLRPALKFHDGEPVLARDVVASLNRWAARDQLGMMIKAVENELTAVDDRTFRWVLKEALPENASGPGQGSRRCLLHHAGSDGSHRPLQTNCRVCRLRPDAFRQERVEAGRPSGIREIPRIHAPPGAEFLARRRQANLG